MQRSNEITWIFTEIFAFNQDIFGATSDLSERVICSHQIYQNQILGQDELRFKQK